jgi:DNA-binding NarL/FixJ family response regulator
VDGRQAVDAAAALKLVLLDCKMPNKNGIEAASELKQKLPETSVVIFALYKTHLLESEGRQAGFRAVVGKGRELSSC